MTKGKMTMTQDFDVIFKDDVLAGLVPANLSDQFFDALYGDADEGAYDISLHYGGNSNDELKFEFHLDERPGKCLACNLTYGLPEVFSRHPLININGIVKNLGTLLDSKYTISGWKIGRTRELSRRLHIIPLIISVKA